MKCIPLTQGKLAVVDDEDYEWLSSFKWHYNEAAGARRKVNGKHVLMHRVIMGSPSGLDVDHRDHDRLNNRRSNLRVATRSQNQANRSLTLKGTATNVKGVTFHNGKYEVKTSVHGHEIYVGRFDSLVEARAAYIEAAIEHHGEFAYEG